MHKKSELEAMSIDELNELAKSIGANSGNDKMDVIYDIIGKEAETEAKEATAEAKPKRIYRQPGRRRRKPRD